MKTIKKLVLVKLLLLSVCLFAQEVAVNNGVFQFEQETIDYGTIEQNSDGNRKFIFKNTGNSPIVITNVKGSCGCTVATKPEKPILPNQNGEIKVKYATNRLGKFSKEIKVSSNASEPIKVIKITGNVIQPQVASSVEE